ncbi:hypothetical protein L0128_16605, partial [candidate division KSB1 bacterium]|nr:hypothetical protein [candidate division KSB1 bacterium]
MNRKKQENGEQNSRFWGNKGLKAKRLKTKELKAIRFRAKRLTTKELKAKRFRAKRLTTKELMAKRL